MRRSFAKLITGGIALIAPLFVANQALAADCGWLAEGSLDCELVTTGCDVQCTPVKIEAQCGASCEGSCNVDIDASCTESCEASCMGSCKPGSIDCEGSCETDCSGRCETSCKGDKDETTCVTNCKGSCQTDCQADCSVKPATCEASCHASCHGSCSAQVDVSCQASCQGKCSGDIEGGCKADCSKVSGALFCNGQYVSVSDLDACVAEFSLDVDVNATCNGSGCTATASCNTAGASDAPIDFAALGAMALGCGLIVSRRRRDKK
jgi:hypothetical protein